MVVREFFVHLRVELSELKFEGVALEEFKFQVGLGLGESGLQGVV